MRVFTKSLKNAWNLAIDEYEAKQEIALTKKLAEVFQRQNIKINDIDENGEINIPITYVSDSIFAPLDYLRTTGSKICAVESTLVNSIIDSLKTMNTFNKEYTDKASIQVTNNLYKEIANNITSISINNTVAKDIIDIVTELISSLTEGFLYGIMLKYNEKCDTRYINLTNPVSVLMFKQAFENSRVLFNGELVIYYAKNIPDHIKEANENSKIECCSKEYRDIILTNVLLAMQYLTKPEMYKTKAGCNSNMPLFNTALYETCNQSIYVLEDIRLPVQNTNKNIYSYYYAPVDILANSIVEPYYGGVLFKHNGINLYGINISPMKSPNVQYNENTPLNWQYVCTGKLSKDSIEGLAGLNYANLASPFYTGILAKDYLGYIKTNIEVAYELLTEKVSNETENRDEIRESSGDTTEGNIEDTREEQSTQYRNTTVEESVATDYNPFERDLSYQERVSSTLLGSDNEESVQRQQHLGYSNPTSDIQRTTGSDTNNNRLEAS